MPVKGKHTTPHGANGKGRSSVAKCVVKGRKTVVIVRKWTNFVPQRHRMAAVLLLAKHQLGCGGVFLRVFFAFENCAVKTGKYPEQLPWLKEIIPVVHCPA